MNYDLYCDVLVGEMDDVMFPVWSAQSEECISLSKKVLLMRVAHDLEDINRLTNDMFEDKIIFEALKLNAHFEEFATGLKHFIDIKIQFIALYRLFFCQTFCFLMW